MTTEPRTIGHIIRSGRSRVTYRPDWSESWPWVGYKGGTAGPHFQNEQQAQRWLDTNK